MKGSASVAGSRQPAEKIFVKDEPQTESRSDWWGGTTAGGSKADFRVRESQEVREVEYGDIEQLCQWKKEKEAHAGED